MSESVAVCFEWETYWPHAVRSMAETRTTPDRGKVTCDSCLWALGTQVSPPPNEAAR